MRRRSGGGEVKLTGRVFATLLGAILIWFAVTMALSPELIIPIPEHGTMPERVAYDPNVTTEIARYVASGLLGFFGLTLAVAPWRRRPNSDDAAS